MEARSIHLEMSVHQSVAPAVDDEIVSLPEGKLQIDRRVRSLSTRYGVSSERENQSERDNPHSATIIDP